MMMIGTVGAKAKSYFANLTFLPASEAAIAIAVACISSGLLFTARGGYMPYFFPLYQGLSGLDYATTAVLLNIYLAANSVGSPFVGILVDRLTPWQTIFLALTTNLITLVLSVFLPFFIFLALSVCLLGMTFTMGRIVFNKILIGSSDEETLRRSVSIRAMLMTGGSFAGNLAAAWFAARGFVLAQILLVYLILAIAWLVSFRGSINGLHAGPVTKPVFWARLPQALGNRPFVADLTRLFIALLPYGCWGTIIPKYVLDRFGDASLIPAMYACSTLTIVALTYGFNRGISTWCHDRGFSRRAWPYVAAAFFLGGLALIASASGVVLLCVGAIAFGLGEVIFTPCMDEAVKLNAAPEAGGTYIGLVQLTEGGARLVGSAASLTIYGFLKDGASSAAVWPSIIVLFALAIVLSSAAERILSRAED